MKLSLILILFAVTLGFSQGIFSSDKPEGLYTTRQELLDGKPTYTNGEYVLHNSDPFTGSFSKKDTTFDPSYRFFKLRKAGKRIKYMGFVYAVKQGESFYLASSKFLSEVNVYETHSWAWGIEMQSAGVSAPLGAGVISVGAQVKIPKQLLLVCDNSTGKWKYVKNRTLRKLLKTNSELYTAYENDSNRRNKKQEYLIAFCAGDTKPASIPGTLARKTALVQQGEAEPEPGSVTLKLKNGKSYNGEIVNETPAIYNLKVGENNLTIYKSVVVEKVVN